MEHILIDFVNHWGYLGIFFLLLVENVFPFAPSEIILLFGGCLTTFPNSNINFWGIVIASVVGTVIGSVFLYLLGRYFNKERIIKIVDSKIGKFLKLKISDVDKVENWFAKHEDLTLFFGRFIPVIRILITAMAGVVRMNIFKFMAYIALSSFVWNTFIIYLGLQAGSAWKVVASAFGFWSKIAVIVILFLCLIVYIFLKIKRKKVRREE